MATVNEYATVVHGSELVFVDRNNPTLGSEVFIEPHRTVIQHSLQIQDVDAILVTCRFLSLYYSGPLVLSEIY